MNNRNHNHHNNEQRQDENPSGHILKRVLPHREDESIGTARYMSTTPTYQITIEHGSIRIGQECASIAAGNSCQHTDYQEMRS
jgi:hypothetical protein